MKISEKEMQMTFNTYAKGGSISAKDFNKVVRAVGLNPTEADVAELKKKAGGGDCDFDAFKKVVYPEVEKSKDNVEQIVDSFSVFDQDGSGTIPVTEFKHVLSTMGEGLSQEEMAEVMTEVEEADGKIDYREFANMIFGDA
mmetsp:Transcript_19319/g.47774  ORF Transcript_19319/g.47774 Transcript_19319/m.47774 type:complete len:141 (-) Transcript_19319:162-584(-)|eukprot:CAMPEP_0113633134 /NCGR_PEP_ID=MMETSP0017_2-20120614/17237_1 /TAXON_ID=2856 /ORGANISM="Cylindrotheca closterium" /LENGTH=140 /DNA_ID=CAMNT_0000543747 /DNA_START=96 /DNA_END=518 /DNA_ORIENTATION=- /assembly_acc=CAM_ASM_000147